MLPVTQKSKAALLYIKERLFREQFETPCDAQTVPVPICIAHSFILHELSRRSYTAKHATRIMNLLSCAGDSMVLEHRLAYAAPPL